MRSRSLLFVLCLALPAASAQILDRAPRTVGGGYTFAGKPAAASYSGKSITVTDCLTLACAVGGGTLNVVLTSDGSAWNPAGGGTGTVTVVGAGSLTSTALVTGGGSATLQTPEPTATMDADGNIVTPGAVGATNGFASGATPPTTTPGTAGLFALGEGTAPTAAAGADICYANSTSHVVLCSYNNGSFFPLARTIATGAKALATGAISSETCTTAQTDTATGAATTDTAIVTFASDPTGVTGYVPLTAGGLTIYPYVTSNTMNFKVCNFTAGSITPGALSLNWRVVR